MTTAAAETIVEKRTLLEEASTLKEILEGIDLSLVYVEDEEGRQFGSAKIVKQTLTDGSEVFNLVLCVSA